MHIVVLADDSSSMSGSTARTVTEAIRAWVNELNVATRGTKPYFRFSMIMFGSSINIVAEKQDIRDIRPDQFALEGAMGTTNITLALEAAKELLVGDAATRDHCPPFVFIFTDGDPTDQEGKRTDAAREAAFKAAAELRELSLPCGHPYVVALGYGKVNDNALQGIASEGLSKRIVNPRDLIKLLPELGTPTVYLDEDEDDQDGSLGQFKARIQEL